MARNKLSIPLERRKVALKSQVMQSKVKIAEHKERIALASQELKQMRPPKPRE